jgi:hypothetical protein
MSNKTKLECALEYEAFGWSIIPTKKDKTPYLISWKEYQNIKPSAEQINRWWAAWPDANPAVITGKISNIIVLDLDAKHNRSSKEFQIPPTVCAKSGNNGEHFFFRYPGVPIESKSAIAGPGVDIRADGGYILLSPSINETGGMYEWNIPFESNEDIVEMPEWFLKLAANNEKGKKWLLGKDGVAEGSRNETAASMVGKILSSMDSALWGSLGWDYFVIWNNKNTKPLPIKELTSIWESIMRRHLKDTDNMTKSDNSNQADKLINITESNKNIVLFHDNYKDAYISIPRDNHQEIWRCSSGQLKDWLSKVYWEKYKKAPNSDALNTALNVIKGKARFDGCEIPLFNRTAYKDGIYWYDLAGRDWKAVKIDENGWNIIDNPPIIFRRYNHQKTQAIPETGGNIKDILKYVNIKDADQQILFLVWIVSCYIPNFPHPVPYVYGQKGSAKSTISKIVRELVDPSLLDVISFPKNEAELIQILSHNWTVFFDNVSQISENISDLLCRAVTGGSFSKRKLYTDDEDVICTFRSCLGINGINLMAVKPDLLQRSILFELSPIPESEKIEEQVLWPDFEIKKPKIIGAIFDALVKTRLP